ncbi:hypothetical protein [Sorangium sp. So ce117]|uniref:hypothetical protein n=1 Tax=Sorangium sp. So ce117 TaxID=3133277 RepID=UPI003F5FB90B
MKGRTVEVRPSVDDHDHVQVQVNVHVHVHIGVHHVAPVFHGDTVYGESTVLAKELVREGDATGIVSFETRGYKQDGTLVITFRPRVAIRRAAYAAHEPARRGPRALAARSGRAIIGCSV